MKLLVTESVWNMLSENIKDIYTKKGEIAFEEDEPATCVFCGKEMPEGQLGFCMPCLVKNDPKFWHDKKGKEGEKKRQGER